MSLKIARCQMRKSCFHCKQPSFISQSSMAVRPNNRPASTRWLKWLAWIGVTLVVLAVAGVMFLKSWVNSYLRSPEFRRQIAERTRPMSAACMHAIVSRPGVVGNFTFR